MDIVLNKRMPEDIIGEISSFLPIEVRIWLSKTDYMKYREGVPIPFLFDNYIRRIIRLDCDFILQCFLKKRAKKWNNIRSWDYGNYVLPTYMDYLNYLCIEYESQKCRSAIKKKLSTKNLHRKIRIKNNKTWSN